MSLSPTFREEYYELLKKCILTVKDSNRYSELFNAYSALCEQINTALKEADALCTDAERLIDKNTGNIRADAAYAIAGAHLTVDQLVMLATLYAEKKRFAAERGWSDELLPHVHTVLAISAYEEMEKAILAELGRDRGQEVIYRAKKEVLAVEEACGIRFFADEVAKMETLFRLKRIYPVACDIRILDRDSTESEFLVLADGNGRRLQFEKGAQVQYNGEIYLELSLIDEIPTAQKLLYYRIENNSEGQVLLLEEDPALRDILWHKIDALIT